MADRLRIDTVTTPAGGTIGMTMCPGRVDRTGDEGPIVRDLAADLAVIADWRPDVVVSLIEDHEPGLLGVPDLFARLSALAAAWRHHPIRDLGVPGAADAWAALLDELGRRLDGGGRVIVHCRAGLGRTGMLAASLLARSGLAADEALAAVRRARPGTVETEAQVEIVRASAGS
jgi:hypothetical protein